MGINALLTAAIIKENYFFSQTPSIVIEHNNHVLTQPNSHKWAKRIDDLIPVYEDVCEKVSEIVRAGQFPLIISGDHASAGGTIAGIKKAHPEKRLGIIWIDAHADLHSPYTSPSGNIHGMPLATVLNEDNRKFDPGDVETATQQQWEVLKKVGGVTPKASPKDLIFIGVRDTEKEEDYLIEQHDITNYDVAKLRKKGVRMVINEIKEKLKDCDMVYISFDVDSLDCDEVSLGTGTPVPNGLSVKEAREILESLLQWDKVISLEVTEINPLLDNKKNKMAETALSILEYALDIR